MKATIISLSVIVLVTVCSFAAYSLGVVHGIRTATSNETQFKIRSDLFAARFIRQGKPEIALKFLEKESVDRGRDISKSSEQPFLPVASEIKFDLPSFFSKKDREAFLEKLNGVELKATAYASDFPDYYTRLRAQQDAAANP